MKSLKIAILTHLESPTITAQLVPHLQSRGHHVDSIDLSALPDENVAQQPAIQALLEYDVVYYRSGLNPDKSPVRILQLEAFLRAHSIKTVNLHFTEHPHANSKIYEAKQADVYGLTIPKTVHKLEDFSTLQESLGLPFIVKTDQGTQGSGVHMVKNETEFNEISQLYPTTQLLFQEFVPHNFEYRVFIIAGTVISYWKKAPAEGDFRTNEAQGGQMINAEKTYPEQITTLADITYRAFNFEIFVVDFMLHKATEVFYFTEINLNPGWVGEINEITTVDRSTVVAEYFEKICS